MQWLKFIKPILTVNQLNRLSNIFDNAGQVMLGIAVISPIITGFDRIDIFVVLSGIITTLVCWTVSVTLSRKE